MDLDKMKRIWKSSFLISLLPMLAEAALATAISAPMFGIPWVWAAMLGFMLSAPSPSIVLPILLEFKEKKLGEHKGIHTPSFSPLAIPSTVIGSITLNSVWTITAFGIVKDIYFSTEGLVLTILRGPIDLTIGFLGGTVIGFVIFFPLRYFGSRKLNFVVLYSIGALALFGAKRLGKFIILIHNFKDRLGAGALMTTVIGVVANFIWTKCIDLELFEGKRKEFLTATMQRWLSFTWLFVQPVLFGVLGATLDLKFLATDPKIIGFGVVVIFVGVLIRMLFAFISVLRSRHLNWKERSWMLFITIPKATVQASLGPLALYRIQKIGTASPQEEYYAQLILAVAILSI